MNHEHVINGIHFRTCPHTHEALFTVQYRLSEAASWKTWPGFFLKSSNRMPILKMISQLLIERK